MILNLLTFSLMMGKLITMVAITYISTQLNYLNMALDTFNSVIVSPFYYSLFTSFTILASEIMFKYFVGKVVLSSIRPPPLKSSIAMYNRYWPHEKVTLFSHHLQLLPYVFTCLNRESQLPLRTFKVLSLLVKIYYFMFKNSLNCRINCIFLKLA